MEFGLLVTLISMALIFVCTVYSVWAYWWVKTNTKFKWVKTMILLCMLSSIHELYGAAHDIFTGWDAISEAIFTFLDVAPFWGFQNTIYWLFGFKYWVIGKEVPDMINEEQEFSEDKPV
jgi:Flp pilus assembly pilin Flp